LTAGKKWLSIQLALAALVLLPLVILASIYLLLTRWTLTRITDDQVHHSMKAITQITEGRITRHFEQASRLSDALIGLLQTREIEPLDLTTWRSRLFNYMQGHPEIASIMFVDRSRDSIYLMRTRQGLELGLGTGDENKMISTPAEPDGRIRWNEQRAYDYDVATRPWYRLAMSMSAPIWTPAYQWFEVRERSSENVLAIAYTRQAVDQDGTPLGVLSIDMTLDDIAEALADMSSNYDAHLILIDENDRLLASSEGGQADELRTVQQLTDSENPFHVAISERLAELKSGEDFDLSIGGSDVLYHVGVRRLQTQAAVPWRVVVLLPESEMLMPARAALRWMTILGVFWLSIMAIAALGASRLIVSPLRQLSQFADRIGQGNFDQRVHVGRTREIRSLSDSLNRMAAELNQQVRVIAERDSAEKSSQIKSRLIAHVSHEFRTPLTAIIGYAELVRDDPIIAGNAQAVGDTRNIITAARHLLTLVNNLLDLSRIEAGMLKLDVIEFDVDALVRETVETLRYMAEKRKNTVTLKTFGDLGRMRADPARTKQILYNLVSNAIKFCSNGSVVVAAFRAPEHIFFVISDTGSGMTTDQMEHLFKPFTQVHANQKLGANEGAGLGLAITRQLTQAMHGHISVVSEPGRGSEFTVILPIDVESPIEIPAVDILQETIQRKGNSASWPNPSTSSSSTTNP
jgi:signal transduction histidine kinase